ncbi:hypothetical protein X801_08631 [Opisthorchis viverrini]|uniref:Uncharacterized protein n=1 Tax=Opisthorchis viverrini TaxID=6198 RepID=A0A1S8WMH3_OPIVI|nr:hypothetical protein X801_08631 [Opisthorchis viverrini]
MEKCSDYHKPGELCLTLHTTHSLSLKFWIQGPQFPKVGGQQVGNGIEPKNTLRVDEMCDEERCVQLKTFPAEVSATYKLDSKPCKRLCRKPSIYKLHAIVFNILLCV